MWAGSLTTDPVLVCLAMPALVVLYRLLSSVEPLIKLESTLFFCVAGPPRCKLTECVLAGLLTVAF